MSKIKLFILSDTLETYFDRPAGGAEKQILALCRRIDKEKFEPIVGCLSPPARLLSEISKENIKTMCFGIKRVYSFCGILRGIRFSRFLQKENINIVMTYHFGADIWGTFFAKLAGVPIIISNRRDAGFWRKPIHKIAYKLVNRWVNRIITISEAVYKMVLKQESAPCDKLEMIHNGVDIGKYDIAADKDLKYKELKIPLQSIVIGCVGNIRPVKGHSYLVESARQIIDIYPNAHFLLIGRDKAEGNIAREINRLGLNENIHILGLRNDVPELLALCDICVLPSLSEGMSNALLEYMAAGKPIVATDAGGNPDLIQDGINGLLARKADSKDLAEKIIHLLKNKGEAKRLSLKAKEDAKEKFSIEKMIGRYEKLFEELSAPANPAVVLGLSANGLSIARSLGRKGIPVIGVGQDKNEPGLYSKFLKSSYIWPNPIYGQEEFLNLLISLGKKSNKKTILFATADEYIQVISKHREALSEYFNFLLPEQEIVDALLDKKGTYELTKNLGFTHPKTYFAETESEIKEISISLNYPCILKPRSSHLWRERYAEKKVSVVNSQVELLDNFRTIKENCLQVLAQEIIPGPDSNVYEFMACFDEQSKPLAYFTCRKIRQYPPNFGIGCLSESKQHPKIAELGLKFLKKINHKGLAHIEFKIDSRTNEPVFIEANLRTSFIGELCIASGIDLPYIAYKNIARASADEPAAPISEFKEGVKLLNLELDLGSFYRSRKNKEIKFISWIKSYQAEKLSNSYFALDDLRPFLFIYSGFTKTLLLKVKSAFLKLRWAPMPASSNGKINILHLISSNGLYGAEKAMLGLASDMNYNGCKSYIGAIKNLHNPHTEVIDEAKKANIPTYAFESNGRISWQSVSRLSAFIKENSINVLHTHNYKANFLGLLAAKNANVPIIATLHGYIGAGAKLKLYETLDRFILRYFNKVILVDNSLRKWFRNGSIRYEVINNGVDATGLQDFQAAAPPAEAKSRELIIGTVGRLSEEKGHRFLIEAFAKISKEYPDARLLIVGNGELRKDLEILSADSGVSEKVTFTGFQRDVTKYYQQIDIYVSPSLTEHFPMSILEAMSFGKAIVATDVGGTKYLIKDKDTGLLINSGSSEEIYKAISACVSAPSLRKTLGNNAYLFVRDNYSLERMTDSYRKIYKEIASSLRSSQ